MSEVLEWEIEPHQKAEMPGLQEKMDACQYHGTIAYPGGQTIKFYCANFSRVPKVRDGVRLTNAILDTSERYQGMTLKHRRTFYSEVVLFNAFVILLPIDRKKGADVPQKGGAA